MQFLLPLFEDWTYSSLPQSPSVRPTAGRVECGLLTSGAVPLQSLYLSLWILPVVPSHGTVQSQRRLL